MFRQSEIDLFFFLGNYVISNFLKSYISSSRDRLLSCPSLTITLQIRPMCDASSCDDLRLIKVRNGSTVIDEPSFTYQWVIDDFNTKTKVYLFSFILIEFDDDFFSLIVVL